MSAIVRETSEYVEMSDSITLCIVKDGAAGSDAVTYGVQVTPTYETWSDAKNHAGIALMFTKTTGSTMLKYWNVQVLGTAKVYVDGTELEDLNKWVNGGNNKIIFDSFTFDGTNNTPTIGTASVISIELIVDDKIVATANYSNGKQGADGMGALEILCDPETIVIDTDDNGLATGLNNASASLMCLRDGKEVRDVTYQKGSCVNCNATVNTNTGVVTITSVYKQSVTGQTVEVSCTSGSVTVMVTDPTTKTTYVKTIPFSVNVAKFNSGLKADNKRFETTYNYLTNNGTSTNFTYFESKIRQTAKDISLHVSEKSVGRRNMLVGSACRKYGDGFTYMSGSETQYYDGYPLEQIEINSGIDGVNCIHCRTKRTGTDSYHLSGFSWNGISPQGNIKLEKGKNYVLSFYAKTPTPNDIYFIAEVLYQGSKIDTSRPAKYDGPTGYSMTFSVSEANKWELFTVKVSVPSNAKYEYEEINIFARVVQSDFFVDGYICKPMLEGGEEYNGWTLSEQDYDYVGGNLLDGTGTLTKTGNVEVLDETTVNPDGYNNESASVVAKLPPTTLIGDFLQYSTKDMGLKVGEDCVLSFYARAASGYAHGGLQCYLYSPSTGNVMTESSHEKLDSLYNPGDGDLHTRITPTTAWKRYWVHWRPMGNVPQHILFRLLRPGTYKESYDPSTSYNVGDVVLYGGTYYVCQKAGSGYEPGASSYWEATVFAIEIARPKLEVGATMTEWTEKRSDMVDKQALYATGIDIDSKKITLTADKTYVQSNSGEPIAMFSASGGFINSDILNVKHVYAKDANGTVYGHFGYEDATGGTSSSGKKYPLWLGAETCDRAPFAVSSSGDMYANSGMLGPFSIGGYGISSPSFSTGTGMSLGFLITLTGATFNSNNNNYDMAAVIGGHTAYGDPLSYLTGGGDYSDPTYRDFSTSFGYGTMRARQSLYVRKKLDGSSSPSTSVDIHGYNQASGKPYAAMIVDSDCMGVNSPSSNFFGGMACGLLRVSSVSGTNLAAWDENRVTTLVMTNSSRETVPLPKYPEVGQMIWVIQQGGIVYFSSDNSHPIKTANGTGSTVTSGANSNKKGQINLFVWDGQYWNCSYINGGLF